jgi:hypothetical protein
MVVSVLSCLSVFASRLVACRETNDNYKIDELIDWREMQTLVRSMPDLHKTLVLCLVSGEGDDRIVQEIAMATEHAPFRQRTKKFSTSVGSQKKKKKNNQKKKNANDNNDKIDLKNTKSGNNNKRIRTEPA